MGRRRITVGLSSKLADRMEAEMQASGLSISDVVKMALDAYLKKEGN